jgi:hypothetical protein
MIHCRFDPHTGEVLRGCFSATLRGGSAAAPSSCSACLSLNHRLPSTAGQQNFEPKLPPQHERCPHQSQRVQSHRHQEGRAFLSVQQALVPHRAGAQTAFRQGSEPRRHREVCRHWRVDLPASAHVSALHRRSLPPLRFCSEPQACAAMLSNVVEP